MNRIGQNGFWGWLVLLVCCTGCRTVDDSPAPIRLPAVTSESSYPVAASVPDADCRIVAAFVPDADCEPQRQACPRTAISQPTPFVAADIRPANHEVEFEPVLQGEVASSETADPIVSVLPEPARVVDQAIVTQSPLTLAQVVQSVQAGFPLLQIEFLERDVAEGNALSAWGDYDLKLEAYGVAAPMGFYKNYRNGIALKQSLYRGGYVYGGYRLGADDIQPWYKERLTNTGGELKVGAGIPLFQGRTIDQQRSNVLTADVRRCAVEPQIQIQLLQFALAAADAYWSWVAAGQRRDAQLELLELANVRASQIQTRVEAGDLPQIAEIDNQRLIASRETKLIEADRKVQAAAIKLSLFLRDSCGNPQLVDAGRVPASFPAIVAYEPNQVERDVQQAACTRPELRHLELQLEASRIEFTAAENLLLPRIDARIETSKDLGSAADPKNDKTPFELEAGLWGEMPLQRRKAHGKLQALQAKIAQLTAKRQYAADKVQMEVRDAVSAMQAAIQRTDRATTALRLTEKALDLGRQAFQAGDSTVLTLNLYEQATLEAKLQVIDATADFFKARAAFHAAVGYLPGEQ